MKIFRSLLACAALGAALAMCAGSAGCGIGAAASDPTASSPASSHFKADLAIGYRTLEAVDVGAANALQAHAITVDQAEAVKTQRAAFKAVLDGLRTAGDTTASQSTLTSTLVAIKAAALFVAISQGVPKS